MNGFYFVHKDGNMIKIIFKNEEIKNNKELIAAIVTILNGFPSDSISAIIKSKMPVYSKIYDNVDVEVLALKENPLMMFPFYLQ